ncbi:ubiquitin carboxyl-terminal hydrolase 4-like isoform X2 [Micropterus dolomieu]|uniref:ubiquitin carboxyl-terminal hydrolase 4-like isoform X2 n=1 Tax=Micropterus dolomieu TaxID=147949 RepID=UPI001E8D32A6|nr:ubiquitin carboxyl-terminal hydrolase 4-like isoform X2 [Micropterus dolomieu]
MSFFLENGPQLFYKRSFPPPAKYHGLINQGATCYLNSVLQVLFMTKDFREAVERHTNETPGPIDHHLKQLFKDLIGHKAYTNNITKTLGIDRVYEQRDAAEYIEKILRLTSPEASQIFHGLLTYKNICSQCRTEKDNDERFWHLPLALMDSCGKEDYSVVNGIEAYFRPSVFSGENQMYCDECDAKSDATNKCVIKHHPEVLMLLLKRFEFDYSHMTYVKIYCTVDVPYTLQIPENQTYELYAVVDHLGDLRSGHYTATIKDDDSWYRFNDDKVTLLDYQPCQVDNSEKLFLQPNPRSNVQNATTYPTAPLMGEKAGRPSQKYSSFSTFIVRLRPLVDNDGSKGGSQVKKHDEKVWHSGMLIFSSTGKLMCMLQILKTSGRCPLLEASRLLPVISMSNAKKLERLERERRLRGQVSRIRKMKDLSMLDRTSVKICGVHREPRAEIKNMSNRERRRWMLRETRNKRAEMITVRM